VHPKKNLEWILEGMVEANNQSMELHIAGSGDPEYEQRLRNLADDYKLIDRIKWYGFVSGADKKAFFDTISWYLLPSHHENFGIAVAEALAHGVPVAISDQVDLAGDVSEQQAGMVIKVDHTDPNQLLQKLQKLDEQSYNQFCHNAAQLAKQKFSPEAVSTQLHALYQHSIGS
jgi:glycosyltransferase involved in cell wall biosynthesis